MATFDHRKYKPYRPIELPSRTWPDQVLTAAPDWCSVDLRDGNQALVRPMSVQKKLEMFEMLVGLGFKEIEIGFPAAAAIEREFARVLIDEGRIPSDVTVQVLTQARQDLIERTFESLEGVHRAIVHVYNSTSRVQREQVFRATKQDVIGIAENGARWVRDTAAKYPETEWWFQYSPESFSGTEPDYAVEICNRVLDIWQPAKSGQAVILNLPATVEMATPNVYADQIEYFCRNVKQREHVRVSLHTHNDRGCAVAAAELGVMAGADRIEGTLFGNGERTGNMDIVTMAMNLYSQGIDPELDLSNMAHIIDVYNRATDLPVHPRHPWAGELVYAAFSGSHQDAIRKSMAYHREHGLEHWEVAYLPIDPQDLGRRYEEVVRINSQSGKGGIALVLERDFGIVLPGWLHPLVGRVVQNEADREGLEISSQQIMSLFESEFLSVPEGWQLKGYDTHSDDQHTEARFALAGAGGADIEIRGRGQGLVEALTDALRTRFGVDISVVEFDEHALTPGTEAKALAAVLVKIDDERAAACCIDEDSSRATLQAVLSAVGRLRGAAENPLRQAV